MTIYLLYFCFEAFSDVLSTIASSDILFRLQLSTCLFTFTSTASEESRTATLDGYAINGEACHWCCGNSCTNSTSTPTQCEPKNWLLGHGPAEGYDGKSTNGHGYDTCNTTSTTTTTAGTLYDLSGSGTSFAAVSDSATLESNPTVVGSERARALKVKRQRAQQKVLRKEEVVVDAAGEVVK